MRWWMIAVGLVSGPALVQCAPPSARGTPQVAGTAAPPSPRPSTTSAGLEQEVSELVNRHRRARGLGPFALDRRISHQARLHSVAMAAGRAPLGHEGFDDRVQALRRVMSCRRTAENVGFNHGHPDPASAAVRGWLRSRGHRKNIEGPYDLTGVGVASNAAGDLYFTQIFVGR